MGNDKRPEVGSIGWIDLTVADAAGLKDFYSEVTGWKPQPVEMGGYADFTMVGPSSGKPISGICHARGANAGLPAQWLIYITVEDVEASAKRCVALGGIMVVEPRSMGSHGRYCVIQDPAGAVAALFQPSH